MTYLLKRIIKRVIFSAETVVFLGLMVMLNIAIIFNIIPLPNSMFSFPVNWALLISALGLMVYLGYVSITVFSPESWINVLLDEYTDAYKVNRIGNENIKNKIIEAFRVIAEIERFVLINPNSPLTAYGESILSSCRGWVRQLVNMGVKIDMFNNLNVDQFISNGTGLGRENTLSESREFKKSIIKAQDEMTKTVESMKATALKLFTMTFSETINMDFVKDIDEESAKLELINQSLIKRKSENENI